MLHWRTPPRLTIILAFLLLSTTSSGAQAFRGSLTSSSPDLRRSSAQITMDQPLDMLYPGRWVEVPESQLAPHLPDPIPPNWSGPGAIMASWNGGAYDTKRDRLIIWGGGHNDYGGNEIYAFDLNTLSWSRIWGPSPNIPSAGGACNETYPDGNPASRHTYDGLAYLPGKDWFWSNGGSLFCGSGSASFATWIFNFETMSWARKPDVPQRGYSTVVVSSAYDPLTGHVFHLGTRTFTEYDPDLDSWTVRGEVPEGFWVTSTAAIDPVNRLFVALGGGQVLAWDLESWQRIDPVTTGGSSIVGAEAPGFVYDPIGKQFIGWSGGSQLYTLNVNDWTWTKLPLDPGNSITPTNPQSTGTYGRFQYIPSLHALVVVNSIYQNVFLFKLPGSPLRGDLNLDGKVDILDIELCIDVFLGSENDLGVRQRADLTNDGQINVIDVQTLVNLVPSR